MKAIAMLLLTLLLAACGGKKPADAAAAADSERAAPLDGIALDAKAAAAIDIALAPLAAMTHTQPVDAFAAVVDAQPLSQLYADWQAAEAAAAASAKASARTRALYDDAQNLSRAAAETAAAQAGQDRAHSDAFARRLSSEWGGPFATKPDKAMIDALAAGRASLVRIEPPAGTEVSGLSGVRFHPLGSQEAFALDEVWQAPTVTAGRTGAALLALSRAHAWPTGTRGRALLPGSEARVGVLVPRAALVLAQERAWAYVAIGGNRYERREVPLDAPLADGYFVAREFAPGDNVVVRGAGVLLAQELGVDSEED